MNHYLRMNIIQKAGTVVYLELPIAPELKAAIESSPVRHVEFLIYDKVQMQVPDLSKFQTTKVTDFKHE